MYQAAAQAQGQAHTSRKASALVAGLGAAFIASAISLTMTMSGASPISAPIQVDNTAPQCKIIKRQFMVSTNTGSGTVRLREGSYLSPPVKLSTQPQLVVFPLDRPQEIPAVEVITIEGNATDVVLASTVTNWRHEFNRVDGVTAFQSSWLPMKGCPGR
jgi:hypothetical protein